LQSVCTRISFREINNSKKGREREKEMKEGESEVNLIDKREE
jgi:hypothetical protein